MSTIRETDLPGIGHKVQIDTHSGDRIIVVIHDDGKREVFHFDPNDPEECLSFVTMDDHEARQFAAIVGGMSYTPKALQSLEVDLDDLVIDWYTVEPDAAGIGRTIGQLQLRKKTGASVIAVIEPDKSKTLNPGPDESIRSGAVLVVTGAREHVKALKDYIRSGSR